MSEGLIYKDLSYKIYGLLFKAHNELGCYKNEKQYCDKLEILLIENDLIFKRELVLPKCFIGEHPNRNRIDFLVENQIIIEVKAKTIIDKEDYFQIQRYLNCLNIKLGIIVNFRHKYIKPKRIINPNFKP